MADILYTWYKSSFNQKRIEVVSIKVKMNNKPHIFYGNLNFRAHSFLAIIFIMRISCMQDSVEYFYQFKYYEVYYCVISNKQVNLFSAKINKRIFFPLISRLRNILMNILSMSWRYFYNILHIQIKDLIISALFPGHSKVLSVLMHSIDSSKNDRFDRFFF